MGATVFQIVDQRFFRRICRDAECWWCVFLQPRRKKGRWHREKIYVSDLPMLSGQTPFIWLTWRPLRGKATAQSIVCNELVVAVVGSWNFSRLLFAARWSPDFRVCVVWFQFDIVQSKKDHCVSVCKYGARWYWYALVFRPNYLRRKQASFLILLWAITFTAKNECSRMFFKISRQQVFKLAEDFWTPSMTSLVSFVHCINISILLYIATTLFLKIVFFSPVG